MNDWQRMEDYGNGWKKTAQKGPWKLLFRIILVGSLLAGVLGVVGFVGGWFSEAATVAKEEFGPRELLRKYEWFKDAAAQCEKKLADLKVYESRVKNMKAEYEGTKRKDWDRVDKQQYSIWQAELSGVAASYNGLAAEYNAQMAKFNWSFTEAGKLPQGATQPLPREFKPYVEGL